MQRKFIINLGLLLSLNFLIKPFWIFGIDRTIQNMFTSDYGVYFALFNFSLLFGITLDLGITNFNNKNIAQNQHLLSKYFSGIVVFKVFLAIIYGIITFVVGFIIGYDSTRFYMLLFLTINQVLISFIQYLRSNISGLQLYTLDSFLSVLDKLLMIIFCSILIWSNFLAIKVSLMNFVYGQTLAYLTTFIIVFIIVLFKSKQFTFKIDFQFIKIILKQTFPYALLVITMTFYYRMDAVMLDFMLPDGDKQAAIYAQAYRLMDASNQIGVLFATLLLPMFAFMIKEKKKVEELVKLSFSLLFIPSIILAIFCCFFSNQIMLTLYDGNIENSAIVLKILMFCFVAIAGTYIFGTLLTANGNLKILNKIAIIGLVLNLILNLILIPKFKAIGSAYASLITQFIIIIVQIIIAKKVFNFNKNHKFLTIILLYVIIAFVLVLAVKLYLLNFVYQIIISFVGAFLIGLILKVIDVKKMYKIIVEREV